MRLLRYELTRPYKNIEQWAQGSQQKLDTISEEARLSEERREILRLKQEAIHDKYVEEYENLALRNIGKPIKYPSEEFNVLESEALAALEVENVRELKNVSFLAELLDLQVKERAEISSYEEKINNLYQHGSISELLGGIADVLKIRRALNAQAEMLYKAAAGYKRFNYLRIAVEVIAPTILACFAMWLAFSS